MIAVLSLAVFLILVWGREELTEALSSFLSTILK
jgi:hypothetical protein